MITPKIPLRGLADWPLAEGGTSWGVHENGRKS